MKKILATAQLLIFSLIVFTQSVGMSTFAQNVEATNETLCKCIG